MDEIEQLVVETYQHFNQHFGVVEEVTEEPILRPSIDESEGELPAGPGILYHIQQSSSVFVIRTYVSKNIRDDYSLIMQRPEDFPSLRLLEGGMSEVTGKLRFFLVDNQDQAEIIHDQLHNRRFPVDEEMMCNLSDPGFSWWLTARQDGFQLSFTLSVGSEHSIKLGPLGDRELALKNFQALEAMINEAGLSLSMQNETNRVHFSGGEQFLWEELKDLFELGVISETMVDFFKILAKKCQDMSGLEMTWFYLQEVAAMRRFWIQVQYDLGRN